MKKLIPLTVASVALYTIVPTYIIRRTSYQIVQHTNKKGILLTFDDGPNPLYTSALLDLLKNYQIQAVFFVVAEKAAKYPEIIKRIQCEGHVIGLHHYTHKNSYLMTPSMLYNDLLRSKNTIEALTGEQVRLYRPTYGHISLATLPVAHKLKLKTILWSDIFGDWKIRKCNTTLLTKLNESRKDGAIYVLHDCGQNFGADDAAPSAMLTKLRIFLEQCAKENQPFTNAKNWLDSYEH